jgi:hypothetical protein
MQDQVTSSDSADRVAHWKRVEWPLHSLQGVRSHAGGGVSEYSRQEIAQRAGVDPDYVDRLVELGILTPDAEDSFSPDDVRRARWVQNLEQPACRWTGWPPPSGTELSPSRTWMRTPSIGSPGSAARRPLNARCPSGLYRGAIICRFNAGPANSAASADKGQSEPTQSPAGRPLAGHSRNVPSAQQRKLNRTRPRRRCSFQPRKIGEFCGAPDGAGPLKVGGGMR